MSATAARTLATTADADQCPPLDFAPLPAEIVVALEGRVDAVAATGVRRRILEAGMSAAQVVVDLTAVTDLDAAGLAAIVGPRRRLRGAGISVLVRGATAPSVRRTLAVTRFAIMFDLAEEFA